MCNNREFGAILEQSYFHSVSCAILYSIFSCLARATLEWWLRYHEGVSIIYGDAEKVNYIFTTQLV